MRARAHAQLAELEGRMIAFEAAAQGADRFKGSSVRFLYEEKFRKIAVGEFSRCARLCGFDFFSREFSCDLMRGWGPVSRAHGVLCICARRGRGRGPGAAPRAERSAPAGAARV